MMKTILTIAILFLSTACIPTDGSDGSDGANGSDGRDGIEGEMGRDGDNGTPGMPGDDGEDGATWEWFYSCSAEQILSLDVESCTKVGVYCPAGGAYQVLKNADGTDSIFVWDVNCNRDTDEDGLVDWEDNCLEEFNPYQYDTNLDGDGCDDLDLDGDGVPNYADMCLEESGGIQGAYTDEQGIDRGFSLCGMPTDLTGWVCDENGAVRVHFEPTPPLEETCLDTWAPFDCSLHGCPLD